MNGETVTVRRLLPASREEVFDAWLDAEGMGEWMRPGPVSDCAVTLEPYLGGRFRIVMSSPQGEIVNRGEILVLERPSKLQFSWVSSRWNNQETLVTLELRQAGAECELILTHERFPSESSSTQLLSGWDEMLRKLSSRFRSASQL